MFRLGGKYQHLIHGDSCGCSNPILQQVSRRLDRLSRRHFLAGAAATAATTMIADRSFAQSPKILLTRARLFDGRADALKSGVQVLVEGNRIAAVDTTNSAPPEGATVIDCGDRVLMPGLIDAHWHAVYAAVPLPVLLEGDLGIIFAASTAEAERTLLRGFTTVRDMGGPTFSFKRAIDTGIIAGPRIFPAGAMITTTGGHGDLRLPTEIPRDGSKLSTGELMGAAAIVDDAGSLKLRVREQLLQGASQIKIVAGGGVSSPRSPLDMSTFSEDEIRAAVDVAKDWNTYVTVHAYASNTVQRSIRAGVACVEHAHLMDEETARMFAEKNVWLSMQPFLTMEDAASQTGGGRRTDSAAFRRHAKDLRVRAQIWDQDSLGFRRFVFTRIDPAPEFHADPFEPMAFERGGASCSYIGQCGIARAFQSAQSLSRQARPCRTRRFRRSSGSERKSARRYSRA